MIEWRGSGTSRWDSLASSFLSVMHIALETETKRQNNVFAFTYIKSGTCSQTRSQHLQDTISGSTPTEFGRMQNLRRFDIHLKSSICQCQLPSRTPPPQSHPSAGKVTLSSPTHKLRSKKSGEFSSLQSVAKIGDKPDASAHSTR